jgi:four helix bundle protein
VVVTVISPACGGTVIVIGIVKKMTFSHKKLDVYRVSLEYVSWVYSLVDKLKGKHRYARDQLLRASQSIPLNIAEGNGKLSDSDRMRFYGIARGSALECAAVQDVLLVGKAISKEQAHMGEKLLTRIVSMLTRMTQRSWSVKEDEAEY